MAGLRLCAMAAMLALAGCGGKAPRPANNQEAVNVAAPVANEAILVLERSDVDALAGMSPSQRRAYDRGLADCRAGRYQPANHPEAYRIGCAAGHDR